MSPLDLDLLHTGVSLGIGLGIVIGRFAIPEVEREFRRWLGELRDDRARVETERERMLRAATKQVYKDAAMIERMRREREARR